jgi:hypothetical protein
MPRVLTIAGMVVAGLLVLMFGLDLAVRVPFGRASMAMDVAILICAAALGYMSWTTYRELA